MENAFTETDLISLLKRWEQRRDDMQASILDANKPYASLECISQARRHVSKITELNACISELYHFIYGVEVCDE